MQNYFKIKQFEFSKKARKELNYLTGEEAVRREAELREKWDMEWEASMKYAREQGAEFGTKQGEEIGRREGEERKMKEVAKKMLELDMPIEQIIEISGLPEEEIKKLKK